MDQYPNIQGPPHSRHIPQPDYTRPSSSNTSSVYSSYPPLLPAPPSQQHQHQQTTRWLAPNQQKPQQQSQNQPRNTANRKEEDSMSSTSDFVKKLYKMLEDQSFQHVVAWGPQGDCFVVKDMNEFTKSILPRMFKHSNFASFVRQLNKYDFHKVKNTDDNQFGEHSWTFRHPDFHADRRDALENIKRKVPTQRKSLPSAQRSVSPTAYPSHMHGSPSSSQVEALQHQVDRLTQSQEEMAAHVRNLERNYQDVLVEMVNFQRNMAQQDNLMQNLIQYFLQVENGKPKGSSFQESNTALLQMSDAAKRTSDPSTSSTSNSMLSNYMGSLNPLSPPASTSAAPSINTVSSTSTSTSRVWQQAASAGLMNPSELESGTSELEKAMSRQEALSKIEQLKRSNRSVNEQSLSSIYGLAAKGRDEAREVLAPSSSSSTSSNAPATLQPQTQTLNSWDTVSTSSLSLGPNVEQQMAQQGLEMYTVGHLMPKDEQASSDGWGSFDTSGLNLGSMLTNQDTGSSQLRPSYEQQQQQQPQQQSSLSTSQYNAEASSSTSNAVTTSTPQSSAQMLRVRRTTIVPGWAVPPRVLLVDDDAVSRKLSSKFLQVFGCTIDVAVDGVGAVNKMNLEKYDLVLMDIVMPKLDGVSATSMIRKFDHMTPIISMTSNSKPNEVMTYFSSGMNDILQKPFTKQGLLDMLEKHLMHLKVIQQMAQIPRSVGVPPLSDAGFEQALQTHAAAITSGNNGTSSPPPLTLMPSNGDNNSFMSMDSFGLDMDDNRISNPLAGMGLTDDVYQTMLQNLINTGQFPDGGSGNVAGGGLLSELASLGASSQNKRPLDDSVDGREGKRSRFEVVE